MRNWEYKGTEIKTNKELVGKAADLCADEGVTRALNAVCVVVVGVDVRDGVQELILRYTNLYSKQQLSE